MDQYNSLHVLQSEGLRCMVAPVQCTPVAHCSKHSMHTIKQVTALPCSAQLLADDGHTAALQTLMPGTPDA